MNYINDNACGVTRRISDGTVIADFCVEVRGVNEYIQNARTLKKSYLLAFYCPEFVGCFEIDSEELLKLDYSSLNDNLLLAPTVSTAKAEMAYMIKKLSRGLKPTKIYLFDKLGWHTIEGAHFYCAGNYVIGEADFIQNCKISDYLKNKYRLEIDATLSEKQAAEYAKKFVMVEPPVSGIIFATGNLGIMRQLFSDANLRVPCILYVYGDSQTRKTTCVNLGTRMYNRSELNNDTSVTSLRVSSTEFKSEELVDELKDATFLFDDLYKEASPRLQKKHEERVRNLIRNFADNSARTTARSAFENNCQIIVTAEKVLTNKTDIGRTLLLHVKEPINSKRLAECQENTLALSTFYFYFIRYIAKNYSDFVVKLKQEYADFKAISFTFASKYGRLYEQFFLLRFVFGVFLDYLISLEFAVDKEMVMKDFSHHLKVTLSEQEKVLDYLEKEEVSAVNLSKELLKFMDEGIISPGKKGTECFVHERSLYITNSCFGKLLYQQYGVSYSSKFIAAYFRDRYISQVYADNRQKKYNNKAYLILDISELKKDALDTGYQLKNIFF